MNVEHGVKTAFKVGEANYFDVLWSSPGRVILSRKNVHRLLHEFLQVEGVNPFNKRLFQGVIYEKDPNIVFNIEFHSLRKQVGEWIRVDGKPAAAVHRALKLVFSASSVPEFGAPFVPMVEKVLEIFVGYEGSLGFGRDSWKLGFYVGPSENGVVHGFHVELDPVLKGG